MATMKELQTDLPEVFRRVEKHGAEAVTKHGQVVAVVLSVHQLAAIMESAELTADPELMRLVRLDRARKLPFQPATFEDGDES